MTTTVSVKDKNVNDFYSLYIQLFLEAYNTNEFVKEVTDELLYPHNIHELLDQNDINIVGYRSIDEPQFGGGHTQLFFLFLLLSCCFIEIIHAISLPQLSHGLMTTRQFYKQDNIHKILHTRTLLSEPRHPTTTATKVEPIQQLKEIQQTANQVSGIVDDILNIKTEIHIISHIQTTLKQVVNKLPLQKLNTVKQIGNLIIGTNNVISKSKTADKLWKKYLLGTDVYNLVVLTVCIVNPTFVIPSIIGTTANVILAPSKVYTNAKTVIDLLKYVRDDIKQELQNTGETLEQVVVLGGKRHRKTKRANKKNKTRKIFI